MSLTVSLIAVLIPLLFMGDIVGRLFREFAITLAITILVSAAVSLTLTPMMCAKLLRHKPASQQNWFYNRSEKLFEDVISWYGRTLQWVLAAPTGDAAGNGGHTGRHHSAVHCSAEGLLPGAGYGRDSGDFGSAGDSFVSARCRSGSKRWRAPS